MKEHDLLAVFDRKDKKFGVFQMDCTSDSEVDLFFKSFFNSFGYRPYFERRLFDWLYIQNPLGPCNNYILVDLSTNNWIGGLAFAKIGYLYRKQIKSGRLMINGYINPGFEGMGLYSDLMKWGLKNELSDDQMAFGYTHSNNVASKKGVLKSGLNEFRPLTFLEFKLEKKSAFCLMDREIHCNTELFKNFFFDKVIPNHEFSFSRNYEHLNWRFFKRPDKEYSLLAMENGSYGGYMILGYYKTSNGVFRCHIADYRYSQPDVLSKLITSAKYMACQKGCDVLDVLINEGCEAVPVFADKYFVPRDEGYNLMTYSAARNELPMNCHITFGDFDVV